jgi:4-amino-4-deoxy-L-arabinose transferase-like glycosyltransferase
VSEASRRRDRAWPWLALALIVLVGVVLRAIPLLRTGGLLSGIQYDDGVYLWSAALLAGGHLPYLDFTFLHPPGIVLAMAPFGALIDGGDPRSAVILGRSLMLVVAVLDILLVADLGRRWRGWPTGLLAASLYAISLGAMVADATILLEPFLNLACLAALDVWLAGERGGQTARRCVLIGILLAVGLSFKLWAGVYVLVIGGVFLLRGSWRNLAWTAVGGAIAGAVLVLPFVAAAPAAFIQQVVAVQAARAADASKIPAGRLEAMFAFGPVGIAGVSIVGIAAAVLVLAMAGYVAWRGGTFGAVLAALLAAITVMFILSPSFYNHYPAFLVPIAVLVIAGATSLALEALGTRAPRPVTVGVGLLVLAVLLGIGGVRAFRQATSGPGRDDFGAEIARLVPADACLTADDPTWLLVAGRSPAPVAGERPTADLFGERVLGATAGGTVRFGSTDEMLLADGSQDALVGYLERCPFVVLGDGQKSWMPDRWAAFAASHRLVGDWTASGGPQLWQATPAPAS